MNTRALSRRAFLAASSLTALGVTAACSSGDGASGGTGGGGGSKTNVARSTGMAQYALNNTCLQSMSVGATAAWTLLGQAAKSEGFDGSNDQQCLQQATLAGASGMNEFVTGLADDSIWQQFMLSLANQKIYAHSMSSMIPWAIPIEPKYKGYNVGQLFGPFADESYHTGKRLFEKLGGEGDIIHLKGTPGFAGETMRTYGFNKALAEYPGIKIVAEAFTNWDRVTAANVTHELVQAHPNVRAIFGNNDSIGAGAVTALRSLHKKNILVTGVDGDPPFVQMIADNDGLAFCTSAARCDLNGMYMAVRTFDRMMGVEYDPAESLIIVGDVFIDTPDAARKMQELVGDGQKPPPYDAKRASRHYHPDDWQVPWEIVVLDPYREWSPNGWTKDLGHYTAPTSIPNNVPKEYLDAVTPTNAAKVNKRYADANAHFFKPVQELSTFQGEILYTLPLPEGVAAPYTPPKEWQ
jgi:ribose transport system substrate-binding protein